MRCALCVVIMQRVMGLAPVAKDVGGVKIGKNRGPSERSLDGVVPLMFLPRLYRLEPLEIFATGATKILGATYTRTAAPALRDPMTLGFGL